MTNELPYPNAKNLREFIADFIKKQLALNSFSWLQERIILIAAQNDPIPLQICFAAISRKIEKKLVQINQEEYKQLSIFIPGLFIEGWTLHRLSRMYILLNLNENGKETYCMAIESLFINADMNERADIHAALPVLTYPEHWVKFCEEGIRSNMGIVQEAIMYHNPYPAKYLPEAAWNQLVLKAFFTEKNIKLIAGIDERVNAPLAATLIDYAQERWAAKRPVNVQLWRLVAPFINETNFLVIRELCHSEDINTRLAAALTCSVSNYEPAKLLLDEMPELKTAIFENNLSWDKIGS